MQAQCAYSAVEDCLRELDCGRIVGHKSEISSSALQLTSYLGCIPHESTPEAQHDAQVSAKQTGNRPALKLSAYCTPQCSRSQSNARNDCKIAAGLRVFAIGGRAG
eukprot:1974766-Pleurochrysis_carterae.AAC.3